MACLVLLSVCCLPVCAVEYSTEYPSYVPISGGAYIEVQSTLGRGALVFPNQYQNNTFGFSGSGLIFVTLLILQSVGISIPPLEALFRSVFSGIPR